MYKYVKRIVIIIECILGIVFIIVINIIKYIFIKLLYVNKWEICVFYYLESIKVLGSEYNVWY